MIRPSGSLLQLTDAPAMASISTCDLWECWKVRVVGRLSHGVSPNLNLF